MKKVHLIGNAHLDPVWLWRWQEGFTEIKATFRSALDRMNEFPHYIFTSACAAYYMWIEKTDPKMFAEIQERVKEGRWSIVGGMIVQPDCNMPSGESFARHMLISQRYFKEKFGITAKTGYNVDSFGHNGNLPMLLKNGGMDNYVFMRPDKNEKELAESLFVWESDDGSRVKTFRIPFFYNIVKGNFQLFSEIEKLEGDTDMMAFYGVGNHGGGPTIELLTQMQEELGESFVYSDPDRYFSEQNEESLPVVHDDLQFHAKGCYSAYSKIKNDNRRCENALFAAECFSVLSEKLSGAAYPSEDLRRAWLNTLFNQFHDILCGCSIKEAYEDAAYSHGETLSIAQRTTAFSLGQISWNIDTVGDNAPLVTKFGAVPWIDADGLGTPFVVFNPLAHPVDAVVRVTNRPDEVRDLDGKAIPVQMARASRTNGANDRFDKIFKASLPAYGYKVYRLHYKVEAPEAFESPFVCTDCSVDNGVIKACFDEKTGELVSVLDKRTGKDLMSGAASTFLVDETSSDTWAHGIKEFRDVTDICTEGSVKLIESGPVRATVRTVQKLANSTVTRDYSFTADSDVITVKATVDFHEKHRMLKFSVPVNVKNPQVLCEIPFGQIERPTDGSENVCGKWFLMRDCEGGLGIANDSKYSFDAKDNVLTLTVLRGAIFADHFAGEHRDEFCTYMEQGIHEFEYTVFPYKSVADTVRRAAELNAKPECIAETFHKGSLPLEYSGIAVDAENIAVTAIKAHEDGSGTVVRLYETDGIDTEVNITLFGACFKLCVPHNAVKTVIVAADGTVDVTNFLE